MSTTAKTELNEKATELLKEKKDQENIINLSLKDIYYNLIHTIYDILNEVLDKEYIIPIGFIPNKSFEINNDKLKLINDRSISEIFINKQVLEIKDAKEENIKDEETNKENTKVNNDKINDSDSDYDNNINDKLLLDYTKMQYNAELESDDD